MDRETFSCGCSTIILPTERQTAELMRVGGLDRALGRRRKRGRPCGRFEGLLLTACGEEWLTNPPECLDPPPSRSPGVVDGGGARGRETRGLRKPRLRARASLRREASRSSGSERCGWRLGSPTATGGAHERVVALQRKWARWLPALSAAPPL